MRGVERARIRAAAHPVVVPDERAPVPARRRPVAARRVALGVRRRPVHLGAGQDVVLVGPVATTVHLLTHLGQDRPLRHVGPVRV